MDIKKSTEIVKKFALIVNIMNVKEEAEILETCIIL